MRSAPSQEVVAALARELGHVIDEPRASEPERGTAEWHERRVGREETAWRIAEEKLRGSQAWPELEDIVRAVAGHRLGRYREERDRALAADRV